MPWSPWSHTVTYRFWKKHVHEITRGQERKAAGVTFQQRNVATSTRLMLDEKLLGAIAAEVNRLQDDYAADRKRAEDQGRFALYKSPVRVRHLDTIDGRHHERPSMYFQYGVVCYARGDGRYRINHLEGMVPDDAPFLELKAPPSDPGAAEHDPASGP